MKLSRREKILIGILLGIIFFYGYIRFIISPQISKIKEYRKSILAYQSEIKSNESILTLREKVDNEYKKLNKDIGSIEKKYFLSIKQENLIIILNQILDDCTIQVSSISFSKVKEEKIARYPLKVMTVTLPFKGDYQSIIDFLKKIREYPIKIMVKDLKIQSEEETFLSGSIILDFYSLNRKYNDNPLKDFNDNFNKDNPFLPFEGSYMQTLTDNTKSEDPLIKEISEGDNSQKEKDIIYYVVQEGDTLSIISKKFYGDDSKMGLIMEANNIKKNSQVFKGQVLLIPKENKDATEYVVKPGDSIFSISKKFYGDYGKKDLILEYNGIKNLDHVEAGQILWIPKN